jgi:hypothetical protein
MEDNMKRIIVFFVAIVIFLGSASSINAAGNNERYVERGNFSIAIPATWTVATIREYKYKILQGTFENNFTPTINFVDEEFSGQFDEYIEYFRGQIDNTFGENLEYIVNSEFITNNGLRGNFIIITSFQQGRMLQFNFFCFPGNNGKNMIITCANLANNSAKFNELFVNTARTFEWLR